PAPAACERAERLAGRGEKLQADDARAPIGFLDRDLGADLAGQRMALVVARALAGQEQEVAGEAERHIVRDRRRYVRQHQSEFLQAGFGAHWRSPVGWVELF